MTQGCSTPYKLIGTELSLYTGKIRAYLRHKQLPFEEVLSTSSIYRDLIIPHARIAMIPVLVDTVTDTVIQDTTLIIEYIEKRHPEPSVYPPGTTNRLISHLVEMWADEWLVLMAMHYRWSFLEQQQYIFYEFGRTSLGGLDLHNGITVEAQMQAGKKQGTKFSGFLPILGISESTIPAIEAQFHELISILSTHLQNEEYLFGAQPTLGDFALMGPFYAHLFRDPIPSTIIKTISPPLSDYIERTHGSTPSRSNSSRITSVTSTEPIGFSRFSTPKLSHNPPRTLLPLLRLIFRDHIPIVVITAATLKQWIAEHRSCKGDPLPRVIDSLPFTIFNPHTSQWAASQRAIYPYLLWMASRVTAVWKDLNHSEKEDVLKIWDQIDDVDGVSGMRKSVREAWDEFLSAMEGIEVDWIQGKVVMVGKNNHKANL